MKGNKRMERIEYWGHVRADDGEIQSLEDHLTKVGDLCASFAGKFGFEEIGRVTGRLHDTGKYSREFQNRIQNGGPKVDHATAGAAIARELYQKEWGALTDNLIGYCIAGHHTGLCDVGQKIDPQNAGTYLARLKRLKKSGPDYSAWSRDGGITIPEIHCTQQIQQLSKMDGVSLSFLTRMLYSCLVDADYLDTERFMKNGQVKRPSAETLDQILKKATKQIQEKGWLEPADQESLNGRRRQILQACIDKAKTEKPGLFRLTVPTGGGKTTSSFLFALEHAVKNGMDRIIYVAPFTTIIEQNAAVLKSLAGEKNVLEHHSSFDFHESEELKLLELAAENWDIPIIVTTNVQFFESFYGSKPSRCRKLHNVANSVLIFDEVQALPDEYLLPCLETIKQLTEHYGCTAVFCTATQPSLDQFLGDVTPIELCPNVVDQFKAFKRHEFENLDEISEDDLISRLSQENQALCVVNTRKIAQTLYQRLNEGSDEEDVYCLSTLITPKDRKKMIQEIRDRLSQNEKCIVISTSLIEAGVDLDFQDVYRQLSGIDSILQAAGRDNREGRRSSEECKVYIFQLEEYQIPNSQRLKASVAEVLLKTGENLEDLQTIEKYFSELYDLEGQHDQKEILRLFSKGREKFRTAESKMRMIENNGKQIIIPDPEIESLIARMKYGLSKDDYRRLQSFTVQVPYAEFEKLQRAGDVREAENLEELYVLQNSLLYSNKIGLSLESEIGEAIFF